VTAQKKSESLQDVPIAISAFSGEDMRRQGINDFQGISERTPGLLIGAFSPAQPEISIRGIGTKEDGPGANDSTVVSVDDVYVGPRIAQVLDIYDLERVEVLRGPQGTLYGRNSIAGSLNFVTEKPNEEFKLRIAQTVGSNNNYDTQFLVSGAVSEENGLFGKISYSRRAYDGYTDLFSDATTKIGTLEGIDRQSWRAQLRFAPNDQLDATLTIDGAKDDDEGQNREPIGDIRTGPNSVAINIANGKTDFYDSLATEGYLERDVFGAALKIEYDFENVTFTSITAYRDAEVETAIDCCGINGNLYGPSLRENYDNVHEEADQFTQEFRLSGSTDTVNWVTGLFYTDESAHRLENFMFNEVFNAGQGFSEARSAWQNLSDNQADITAFAAYGQATYAFTDTARATLGLRYSTEEKEILVSGEIISDPSLPGIQGPPFGIIISDFDPAAAENDWDSIDFRLALDYDLSDDALLYGSISSGFKSGGFSGSPKNAVTGTTPFDEETVLSYEVGLKSTLFDNTLRFNVSAFFMDYEDLQVTRFATSIDAPLVGEFLTENAGAAEIMGLELETTWAPTENLVISFNWAFLDAEYTDFSGLKPGPNGEVTDFSGNDMRQAPEQSGSINVNYTWDSVFASSDSLGLNVSARYVDDVFYDPDNNPRTIVPSYETADVRLSWTSPEQTWEVDVWANNVTDEEYITHAFSLSGGQRAFGSPGKPRWYGVTFTYNL